MANNSHRIDPGSTYSSESEECILGLVLTRPDETLDEIREALSKDDFFVPAHQEIYQVICDLQDKAMAIDVKIVHQTLFDRKMADVVGSPNILTTMLAKAAFIYGYKTHVKMIKDKSLIRQLQRAMGDITMEIALRSDNAEDLVTFANNRVCDVGALKGSSNEETRECLVDKTFEVIERMHTEKSPDLGIYTQYHNLDRVIGCFKKGELITLAARTGVGKSALAINMMDKMSHMKPNGDHPGHKVGFFSLEMSSEQVQRRSLSALSHVELGRIQKAKLTPEELERIRVTRNEIKHFRGWFEDNVNISLAGIKAKSRKWVRRYGVEIIFIDYLQLINHQSSSKNRHETVAEISRGLKCLAKELKIPIVAMAQLNREVDEDKRPTLSHLRESGAIEQDSDVVLLLHRKEKQEEGEQKRFLNYELNVAKQRNGPTEPISLKYMPSITRFFYPNEPTPTEE